MKRIVIVFITLLFFAISATAEYWRVYDNAELFSAEDIEAIEQAIFAFQRKTNYDFAVLTTDDYIGKANWQAVADSFYDSESLGFGHQANGMLYYIDMNQYTPYISTCGEMIDILDANTLGAVHDSAFSFLATEQYKDAVIRIIESTTKAVVEYKKDAK